jgi:hypothetical protein
MDMITLAMAKAYSDSKGGYVETTKKVFGSGVTDEDGMVVFDPLLKEGSTYTVTFGGVDFVRTCKKAVVGDAEYYYIGNGIVIGLADNGDPFSAAVNDGVTVFVGLDGVSGKTVTIMVETEITVPIKPEFLPGVCLPVVELSTNASGEETELTAKEGEALSVAIATGLPVVVKMRAEDVPISFVAINQNGVLQFLFGPLVFTIESESENNDKHWFVRIQEI